MPSQADWSEQRTWRPQQSDMSGLPLNSAEIALVCSAGIYIVEFICFSVPQLQHGDSDTL